VEGLGGEKGNGASVEWRGDHCGKGGTMRKVVGLSDRGKEEKKIIPRLWGMGLFLDHLRERRGKQGSQRDGFV